MQKSIEIIIDGDGNPTITASGYKGKTCEEATAIFEKALGVTTSKKHTNEYFAGSGSGQSVHN